MFCSFFRVIFIDIRTFHPTAKTVLASRIKSTKYRFQDNMNNSWSSAGFVSKFLFAFIDFINFHYNINEKQIFWR